MQTVIWIGIAAIIVIAAVIAAIGRPGDGPGGSRVRNVRSGSSQRRVRTFSGVAGHGSTYGGSSWGGDTGFGGSCGGDGGGSCSGGGSSC